MVELIYFYIITYLYVWKGLMLYSFQGSHILNGRDLIEATEFESVFL